MIVQIGSPVELFERPKHAFVGHFIGSPGMNLLPCNVENGKAVFASHVIETVNAKAYRGNGKQLELGVRPEFVRFAPAGIPVQIVKVADAGRYRIVEARHNDGTIKLLVPEGAEIPSDGAYVEFDPAHTQVYEDGWMVT
jgi:glycerol transport system ATP-binding protein